MAVSAQQRASILADLERGSTLRQACRKADLSSHARILELVASDQAFADQYARARESGYAAMADAILDVADDQTLDPNSRRVMVDSRKWILARALPKVWGDRLDLQHSGSINRADALSDEELAAVLAARPTGGRGKTD